MRLLGQGQKKRLRIKIFSEEMGANLVSANKKIDVDIFDDYCEHLIVRNKTNDKSIITPPDLWSL